MKKILLIITLSMSFCSFNVSAACSLAGSIWQCQTEGEAFEIVASGTQLCKAVWGDISAGAPASMGAVVHQPEQKRFVRNVFDCKSTSNAVSSAGVIVNWVTHCTQMVALPPGVIAGSSSWDGKVCYQGCQYHKGNGDYDVYQFGGSSNKFAAVGGFTPSGAVCADIDPKPKTDPECVPSPNNQTQCLREDGSHCAKGASGTMYCWKPKTDVSDRVNPPQNEYATRRPGPPVPPTAPPNTTPPSTWNPPTRTGTTTITNNSNGCQSNCTYNYNTNTGNGSNGGPGGPGGPGTDPPDPDGEGEGTCDPAKETCAPGSSASEVGDLYTESGSTVTGVMSTFTSQVTASPLISSATSFFTYTGGGSCPVFTVPASEYWSAMSFDLHCQGAFAQLFQFAGFLVLAVAAFCAFNIAFY